MNYSVSAHIGNTEAGIFTVIYVAIMVVAMWKMFEKAGVEGWKAVIPFYNIYEAFKVFWGNGWICLLLVVPVVGFIVALITNYKMAKSFGHGFGYTLGLIVLPFIFAPVLGFGKDEYVGPLK